MPKTDPTKGKPDNTGQPATDPAPQPEPQQLEPFIVERSTNYKTGAVPVSGYFALDFDTVAGRQSARDLAHDLLFQAECRENATTAEEDEKVTRITNILLATTEQDEPSAREQAKALIDAGMEFRK